MALAALGGGCEPEHSVRGILCAGWDGTCTQPTVCIPALRERDCGALRATVMELGTPEFDECFRLCPSQLTCPHVSDIDRMRDCNCIADCVEQESQEFQDAYLDFIDCEVPPECR